VNEEDDSGHSHSDPDYPMNEGEEGGEGDDNEVDSGKASLTPLWRYVTKLEEGRGGGTTKFLCPHGCRPGKPYSGSYTRVRRHLCGVLDSDDNRGSIGIAIFPKITQEERENYIKIEEVAQRMNTKKQKVQPDASSPFSSSSLGGRSSPSGSGSGSKRTIEDFLDITGREEVDAKVARFLYACGVPFNVLRSPYWHSMVKAINKAPIGYKSPRYEKARTVLLDKEKAKVKRALTRFTDGWADVGVSIVSDGWTNVRNQHLINILGVSSTGAVFLGAHDSSSVMASSQNIADILLKTIDEVGLTLSCRKCPPPRFRAGNRYGAVRPGNALGRTVRRFPIWKRRTVRPAFRAKKKKGGPWDPQTVKYILFCIFYVFLASLLHFFIAFFLHHYVFLAI
jgi:hypothetical protein